jgi:hypothetical protein
VAEGAWAGESDSQNRLILGVMPCQEETERALPGGGRGQDEAWDEAGAEAGWAGRSPPAPAGIASVPVVDTRRRTRWASHAIKGAVRRAVAR